MNVDWSQVAMPDVGDPLFQPFWDGTKKSELRVQACGKCGQLRWPPRPLCLSCESDSVRWERVDANGVLHSWVVVHRSFTRGFVVVPYVVGLVEVSEIPMLRFLGNLVEVPVPELRMGMRLEARFMPATPSLTLVYWGAEEQEK